MHARRNDGGYVHHFEASMRAVEERDRGILLNISIALVSPFYI
jgi:hypothetical protein